MPRSEWLKRHAVTLVILVVLVALVVQLHLVSGGRYQLVQIEGPYVLRMDTRTGNITPLLAIAGGGRISEERIREGFRLAELDIVYR
jgi:hypothetical protein